MDTLKTYGTVGTAAIGTLVANGTPGQAILVKELSIVSYSGTPDVCIGFGTAQNGTNVLARGLFGLNQGIEKDFGDQKVSGGTAPVVFTLVSGSGTVAYNISYEIF